MILTHRKLDSGKYKMKVVVEGNNLRVVDIAPKSPKLILFILEHLPWLVFYLHEKSRTTKSNYLICSMETLKRHLPFSGQDGLHELKKIAIRFEEKICSAASSQVCFKRWNSLYINWLLLYQNVFIWYDITLLLAQRSWHKVRLDLTLKWNVK